MKDTVVPTSGTPTAAYLGRVLDAIELVSSGDSIKSYRQAARLLGVPSSTVHRLLTLLTDRGYCDRAHDGSFGVGPRLLSLGLRAVDRHWDRDMATSVVAQVGAATGESASLGFLVGDEIVLVARHNSPGPLTVVASVGDTVSASRSALGKAVLANVPTPVCLRLLTREVGPDAPAVLRALDDELAETRTRHYSVDEEGYAAGLRCRAVAVLGPSGDAVGALSVSGPSVRFSRAKAASAIVELEEAARRLGFVYTLNPNVRALVTNANSVKTDGR